MAFPFPSSVFKKETGEVLDEVQTQLINRKHLSYAMATPACLCRELLGLLLLASGCPDASELSLSSMEKWPYCGWDNGAESYGGALREDTTWGTQRTSV